MVVLRKDVCMKGASMGAGKAGGHQQGVTARASCKEQPEGFPGAAAPGCAQRAAGHQGVGALAQQPLAHREALRQTGAVSLCSWLRRP